MMDIALIIALDNKMYDIVQLFLDMGADPNATSQASGSSEINDLRMLIL